LADVTVVDLPFPLLPVVTELLEVPSPECTVTEFPPVVCPETFPPPAVTELVIDPEGARSPGLSCTILQPSEFVDWPEAWVMAMSGPKLKAANSVSGRIICVLPPN
jgi:hypothetical protein